MIIDPRQMTFHQWTAQMTLLLDKFGPTMKLQDDSLWREWALNTLHLTGLSIASINPYQFEYATDWAIRFSQELEPLI